MVELVPDVIDYGDAPEIFVAGPARIVRLTPTLLRMTYYAERESMGAMERRVVLHALRDFDVMRFDMGVLERALRSVATECPVHAVIRAAAH
jgi:hypothetical protein